MDNKVRKFRIKAGLTQTALAKVVGTSQQQIHRVEQGQSAKIDLALRICHALSAPMETVFPKTRATLRRLGGKTAEKVLAEIVHDSDVQDSLGEAGIDADPAQWTLKLQLSSGATRLYSVSGPERRRLWTVLQEGSCSPEQVNFAVFETETQTVALNRAAMAYGHLLFDAPFNATKEQLEGGMSVFFLNQADPVVFDVEPDDAPGEIEDPDETQLRRLLFGLNTYVGNDEVFVITDVDGETAFIRAANVALIEISKDLTDAPADFDDEEEDDLAPPPSAKA